MNELYTQLELAYIRSTGRKYGVANKMAADLGATTVVYSQLSAMAGSDKWTVNKPNWTFVYSDEMLPENDPEARRQLIIARDRCVSLGLKSHFIMGTALRMNP